MKSPLLKISSIVRLHVHCGQEKYGMILRVHYSRCLCIWFCIQLEEPLLNDAAEYIYVQYRVKLLLKECFVYFKRFLDVLRQNRGK